MNCCYRIIQTNICKGQIPREKTADSIKIEESRNKCIENFYVHAIKQVHIR